MLGYVGYHMFWLYENIIALTGDVWFWSCWGYYMFCLYGNIMALTGDVWFWSCWGYHMFWLYGNIMALTGDVWYLMISEPGWQKSNGEFQSNKSRMWQKSNGEFQSHKSHVWKKKNDNFKKCSSGRIKNIVDHSISWHAVIHDLSIMLAAKHIQSTAIDSL